MRDDDAFATGERLMARRDGEDVDPVPLGVADELDQAGALDRDVEQPERHLDDRVGANIHDGFGFASFIGNVKFMKWRSVCAAVRFGFRGDLLDYLHLPEVHDANSVVVGVRGVRLLQFRNVLNAFCTGSVGHCGYDFVGA